MGLNWKLVPQEWPLPVIEIAVHGFVSPAGPIEDNESFEYDVPDEMKHWYERRDGAMWIKPEFADRVEGMMFIRWLSPDALERIAKHEEVRRELELDNPVECERRYAGYVPWKAGGSRRLFSDYAKERDASS